MVAVGVMAAFVYSVLFLPALMSVVPVSKKASIPKKNGTMDRLADFVILHRNRLYWGMLAVIVALAVFIPRIQINDLFEEYFDHRYTFRTDTDFVTRNLTGFESIEYSLQAGEDEASANRNTSPSWRSSRSGTVSNPMSCTWVY